MQRGVSSSVPACAARFQILYHFGLAEAACQAQSFVAESSATEFVVIEASRTTVDRNGLAFERQIGIGRIVQEDAVFLNYTRSEEHTSELQSHSDLVCRLLLE